MRSELVLVVNAHPLASEAAREEKSSSKSTPGTGVGVADGRRAIVGGAEVGG